MMGVSGAVIFMAYSPTPTYAQPGYIPWVGQAMLNQRWISMPPLTISPLN